MSKTLMDKKVNRSVRLLNRQLYEDVFKDRFFVRQYSKQYRDGIEYYLYELIDRKCPERNEITHGWITGFEITELHKLHILINDFIVTSDFWKNK